MSTLSSLMFISASTIGKDLAGRLVQSSGAAGHRDVVHRWTKIGLVVSAILSVILALGVPSVVRIWYSVGTAIVPGLLVPLMASYFGRLRIPGRYAFWAMLLGWLVSTVWLVQGQMNPVAGAPEYWLGMEPMYPGLIVSLVAWGMGRIKTINR
jgi:Na+/proline symporter